MKIKQLKDRLRTWSILSLMVLATGCLTIEENYTFKKDGSGTMEYVVDLSAMAELMKSLEDMGDGPKKKKDEQGPGALDIKNDADALRTIPGIKKVKFKSEKDGFVQRLSFAFNDVTALNAALNVIMPDTTGQRTEFFSWEGNTLVRKNNKHALELGGDMASDEENDSLNMDGMLQSMHYKYNFSFAQEVSSTDLAQGMTKGAGGPKKLELSTDWAAIMKDPSTLDLRIVLDK